MAGHRKSMHAARKRKIHTARNGLCGECGLPVEMLGRGVVYDHRVPLWISLSDEDDGIWPVHKSPCDDKKTPGDLRTIAKVKRIIRKSTQPRAPSRMQSRGFQKHPTFKRNFNGKVVSR